MMKKITLFLFAILAGFSMNAQLLWFDDLTDQVVIDQYTIEDNDMRVLNSFYTNQGVFLNGSWEVVNFGGNTGVAHFSLSSFTGADSCQSTSDWLMLPALDFTGVNNALMNFSTLATISGQVSIFATTSIAGTSPAASDFTNPALAVVTPGTSWTPAPQVSLASLANQSTVYIAIVNTTTACADLVGVRNILINNATNIEVALTDLSVITDDIENGDLTANYSILDCGTTTLSVDATFRNLAPVALTDTVFIAYQFADDIGGTFFVEDTILDFLTTGLASGASYTHTFSVDPDFTNTEITVFNALIFVNDEGDPTTDNDLVHILVNPASTDLSVDFFETSFEFDFNDPSVLAKSLGWKFENNSAGFTEFAIQDFSIFSDAANFVIDGDNVLVNDYIGPGGAGNFPAINNWAFSPCMEFVAGQAYELSFWHNSIAGDVAPHTVDFVLTSAPNSTSVVAAPLTGQVFNDTLLTEYSASFVSTVSGTYHLGIHDRSPSPGFIMTYDLLRVQQLQAPTANISLSSSSTDEPGVEYCDSTVTVTFSTTGNPSSMSLDWGDGTIDVVTGATQATHTYTTFGNYTIALTATNIVGSASDDVALAFTAQPAPTVTFGPPAISGTTATVTIGIAPGSNVVFTPACARIIIDWGDGTIEEVTGMNAATHTYAAAGSYTASATVIGTGQVTDTETITITGINDLTFVNALSIFPNPSNDFVNVSFGLNAAEDIQVVVYSVDGKTVDAVSFTNTKDVNATFNTADLNNGVYLVKIKAESGISTQKFVVSHK